MPVPQKVRQAEYLARLRAGVAPVKVVKPLVPTTRKGRLTELVTGLSGLRDEYQSWLTALPDGYSDRSDENAARVSDVEAALEGFEEALTALEAIELPRIRID